ncbi:hypothetical protein [Aminipila terrae]|uniref:Uncharacterized protein n=1 Tax=Aminipila terrae TaxID=2697030 RepID=A0A6P1MAW6_9FIRM|nr:hypothetical protein [Aminipila terrae]QHI71770.1 hypothetical protein Ami3637_04650 [Aminipila terrae]
MNNLNINQSSYYFGNPDLRDYYSSCSQAIRNKLDESGVEISTLGELKQVVENMKINI